MNIKILYIVVILNIYLNVPIEFLLINFHIILLYLIKMTLNIYSINLHQIYFLFKKLFSK